MPVNHKNENKIKGFYLKKLERKALEVIKMEEAYKDFQDEDFINKTNEFKERVKNGESLDSLLVEAFALASVASLKYTGMNPFKVQIMGAQVIHGGNIAEMKTGEGKTLTAVLPAYLNALTGKGVHIVTVNEYLAGREANGIIGDLFRKLGLTVGLNLRELTPEQKRAAYNCDILYTTNNEIGFDYLRDNMTLRKEDLVQRDLNYAIIDEVDSILIDEARTPLIISGGARNTEKLYELADDFVRFLSEDDYSIDIKAKIINLTESGIRKAEQHFNIPNLYDIQNVTLLHNIDNALRANYIMVKDVDYVVQDDTVIIVDQFTGRLMHGRQFTQGLHQALEAKEHVEIKKETTTLATITFQNYFRMYNKLSGMTGTAKTEEEEFINIYNMRVTPIPTNKPVIRIDANDKLFVSKQAKFNALIKDVKERHAKGQPILIGTIAIETSELVSRMLLKEHIPHQVLNAKQHEREAEIILKAGELGQVTIATNMAGRGTDIKLGDGVREVGGLAVLGTERHESRRIDNQLRGRSGRQGDPGYTCFFMSAEDDLMARFGSERFKQLVTMAVQLQDPSCQSSLDFKIFSSSIERAQKQIEGNNYDQRKNVLKYDEVMRKQREVIYKQRREILFNETIEGTIFRIIEQTVDRILDNHTIIGRDVTLEIPELYKELNDRYFPRDYLSIDDLSINVDETKAFLMEQVKICINSKKKGIPDEIFQEFYKAVLLRAVDTHWMKHIDTMSDLRQAVSLQGYAQRDPLLAYQEQGYSLFTTMNESIQNDTTAMILKAQVRENSEREQVMKPTGTNHGESEGKKKPKTVSVGLQVGRNDPCPCGSGKKFKYCHGK